MCSPLKRGQLGWVSTGFLDCVYFVWRYIGDGTKKGEEVYFTLGIVK